MLTLSLNGQSTQIVYDGTTFRPAKDSATTKIEQKTLPSGSGNGTYNGEYFVVTENGVQYYFGLNQLPGYTSGKQTTQSVWTVPVYGAHAGDPCNGADFASSSCLQGWRWNLDYTVDLHKNAVAYYYQPETNYYGANAQNTGALYTRGGYLTHIDYGLTDSTVYSATPPEQVNFGVDERCIPGQPAGNTCADSQFVPANPAYWPDVPIDQNCADQTNCSNHGPTFWSRKRLTSIATQIQVGGATQQVDRYDFTQTFPDNGDNAPTLWLDNILHTGLDDSAGGSGSLKTPLTSFDPPEQLPNRVGTLANLPVMYHNRIHNIVSESGAQTTVTYNDAQCSPANVPSDPAHNTMACFPVMWTPPTYSSPQLDWFNKYTVKTVLTEDQHNANQDGTYPELLTAYAYGPDAAWHYDDNETVKDSNRTYGQFRGYGTVETRTGDPSIFHTTNGTNVNDQVALSKTTYFRGMDSNTPDGTGGTGFTLTSQDTKHQVKDRDELAGTVFESDTYTHDGGPLDHATVTVPITIGPTATRTRTGLPPLTATMVRTAAVYGQQAVSYGTRNTETDTFYNTTLGKPTTGMPVQVDDRGEPTATGNTAKCTWTRYTENPGESLALPAETTTNAQDCTSAGAAPSGKLISDNRISYDNNAFTWDGATGGQPPGKGEATLTEAATATSGPTATSYLATAKTTYDTYGRPQVLTRTPNSTAPDGSSLAQTTTTTYTPAGGALPTGVSTTVQVTAGANPTYQTSSVTLDPARDVPVEKTDVANLKTDLTYDPLGRLTAVWLPNEAKALHQPANLTYSYTLSATAPSVVTTSRLLENGSYASSETLYDALLRPRQTQVTAENSSMTVSDTQYDSHGWTVLTNNAYNVAGSPNTALVKIAQLSVPDTTVTDHDGLGRATRTNEEHDGATPTGMTTTTVYTGDTTTALPHTGGVITRTVTDARSQTSELDQYTAPPAITGTAQSGFTATGGTTSATTYTYTPAGKKATVTGPDNTNWSFTYDLLGRKIQQSDPDTGTSKFGFDDAGNAVSTTDARQIELDYTFDLLGRKLSGTDKNNANFKFAVWKYDTLQAGKLSYSARYVPGTAGAYTVMSTGYTSLGNPTGTQILLPASEAPLPTNYQTTFTYSTNTEQLQDIGEPRVAGLLGEDVVYGYDTLGNQSTMQGVSIYAGPVSYTNYGEIGQLTYGPSSNPAWSTYTYDDQTRRLTDVLTSRTQAPGPVVDDTSYTYDPAGNPTSTIDKQSDTGSTTTDTQCYQYDALNRLAQAWTATTATCPAAGTSPTKATVASGSTAYWQSYTYDPVGNRKTSTDHAINGATTDTNTTYTNGCTGTASQCPNGPQPHTLTATSTTGPSGTKNTAFAYNAIGATYTRTPTPATAQNLHWDDEGHLDKITQGGDTTKYLYDADGNQLIRRDTTQTTFFAGDTEIVVNTSATPKVLIGGVRSYTLAGKTVATGSTLPGGGAFYVLTDPHNTATLTLDTTTQKAIRKQYTPYGQTRGTSTTWPDPTRGYLNKPLDATTGYTDIGARKYDPTLGRFITADPVFESASPQQLGGYTYAASNPVAGSDPTGLMRELSPDGGGGDAPLAPGTTGEQCPVPAEPDKQLDPTGGMGTGNDFLAGVGDIFVATASAVFDTLYHNKAVEGTAYNPDEPTIQDQYIQWAMDHGIDPTSAHFASGTFVLAALGDAVAVNPRLGPSTSSPALDTETTFAGSPVRMVSPSKVFRGEWGSSSPDNVFANGFIAKPGDASLYDYVAYKKSAGVISTSKSLSIAISFTNEPGPGGIKSGWVYEVRSPGAGIDINKSLGSRTPFPAEREVAYPGEINPSNIYRARPYTWGMPTGPWVLNPDFGR